MARKNDLARVMADKMPRIKGMKVPTYLCEVIIDIVFDSIKEKLIEDGEVNIKNQFTFKRIDVPEHKKRMPDNTYIVIPFKSKIHVEKKSKFVSDINDEMLELHRRMWGDMQKELGDNPSFRQRVGFKIKWCKEHFPNEEIDGYCFLCEYVNQHENDCDYCPIKWDYNYEDDCCVFDGINYGNSPISEILALPEREGV